MKKRNEENFTKDTPFEEVLESITPMIKRICNDTNGVYGLEKEDLEQELALQAFKSWQSWDPTAGAKFSTYVYDALKKAKNFLVRTAKAQRRNCGRQPTSLDDLRDNRQGSMDGFRLYDIMPSDTICDPESYVYLTEIHEVIDEVIGSMRERSQAVIRNLLDGYTQSEVSEMTGVTQSLVSYNLNLFRTRLVCELEQKGFDLSFLKKVPDSAK